MTKTHENIVTFSEPNETSINSMPMDKLTFSELLKRHPILNDKGWGLEEFTIFMKTGFIVAEIREEDDVLLIDEDSVFKMIDFHDELLTSRQVDVSEFSKCH
jgi:hypothetical protein